MDKSPQERMAASSAAVMAAGQQIFIEAITDKYAILKVSPRRYRVIERISTGRRMFEDKYLSMASWVCVTRPENWNDTMDTFARLHLTVREGVQKMGESSG